MTAKNLATLLSDCSVAPFSSQADMNNSSSSWSTTAAVTSKRSSSMAHAYPALWAVKFTADRV
jgi:hypothetical protein